MALLAATIQKCDIEFASAGKHFSTHRSSFPGRKSKYGVLVQLNSQRQSEQKGLQFLELVCPPSGFRQSRLCRGVKGKEPVGGWQSMELDRSSCMWAVQGEYQAFDD